MRERREDRWTILLAGIILNVCMSCINTFSTFVQPISALTGWEQGKITLAYTLYNTMVCIMGIVIGALEGRVRVRALMYIGSLLYAMGWITAGFARTIGVLYVGFGLLAGTGAGCLYNFCIANTLRWFPDKKGTVSGIILAASAVGPVLCAPLTTVLLENLSVFQVCRVLGLGFGCLMFSVGWLMRRPASPAADVEEERQETAGVTALTWRQLLRRRSFYLLFLVFVFGCTPTMMLMGTVASIGREQVGMSTALAGTAVALLALSSFCGRLLFGALSDRWGRYRTLLLAFGIDLAAIFLLARAVSAVFFLVSMCAVGVCGGALMVVFPPIVSERYGAAHAGLNYSILYIAYSVASFLGPQLCAFYEKATGTYTAALQWGAILLVVAGVLLSLVSHQKRQ